MSKEKQETKEPTHYPYNLISIVPEILWNDPNFKGKAEILLLSYRLKMTGYWSYNDETVAKIFGVSVKYIRKTYAKMIKLGIINENLQLIVDESKKNVIYIKNKTDAAIEQSKKEYAKKKELEDELKSGTVVSNNGTTDSKMESVDSKMESVDSKMESVDSKMESVVAKNKAVSPMKTVSVKESSKESVKESSNKSINESINESVSNNKENVFDIFVREATEEGLKFEDSLPADIKEVTIILEAGANGFDIDIIKNSNQQRKNGYVYYNHKDGSWYGMKETEFESLKQECIQQYKEQLQHS